MGGLVLLTIGIAGTVYYYKKFASSGPKSQDQANLKVVQGEIERIKGLGYEFDGGNVTGFKSRLGEKPITIKPDGSGKIQNHGWTH